MAKNNDNEQSIIFKNSQFTSNIIKCIGCNKKKLIAGTTTMIFLAGNKVLIVSDANMCKPTQLYIKEQKLVANSAFNELDILIKGLTKDNSIKFNQVEEDQFSIVQTIYTSGKYNTNKLNVVNRVINNVFSYSVSDGDNRDIILDCFKVDVIVNVPNKLSKLDNLNLNMIKTDIGINNSFKINKLDIKNDHGITTLNNNVIKSLKLINDHGNIYLNNNTIFKVDINSDHSLLSLNNNAIVSLKLVYNHGGININNNTINKVNIINDHANVNINQTSVKDFKLLNDHGNVALNLINTNSLDIENDHGGIKLNSSFNSKINDLNYHIASDHSSVYIKFNNLTNAKFNVEFDKSKVKVNGDQIHIEHDNDYRKSGYVGSKHTNNFILVENDYGNTELSFK